LSKFKKLPSDHLNTLNSGENDRATRVKQDDGFLSSLETYLIYLSKELKKPLIYNDQFPLNPENDLLKKNCKELKLEKTSIF
jgi:hypothetical protein